MGKLPMLHRSRLFITGLRGTNFEGGHGNDESTKDAYFTIDVPRGSLRLENCRAENQSASPASAAIAVRGEGVSAEIRSCEIQGSRRNGVRVIDGAKASII